MFVVIWATLLFRAASSNSDPTEKPSITIPPLTAGRQTTLTCIAPGRCSGSDPKFTWMWRARGENSSHIVGNNTVNQGHNSTWTFQPSAQHHCTVVTCKVGCAGGETTETTVTLNVTYMKKPETVPEGDALNLTCTIDSFPPSVITRTKLATNTSLLHKSQPDTGTSSLVAHNVTAEDSGRYFCTAKRPNSQDMNLTVIYKKKPGRTTVKEGDALNLTCSVASVPPSLITWTELGLVTTLSNSTGAAALVVSNATAVHSGQYICTAKHLNNTLTEKVDVTVKVQPEILSGSGCEVQSDVLACVCISAGFPLPTIKWPLLENHTEYTVITTVSNHTVNSTVILTVKDHSSTSAVCVSSNESGKMKGNLTINKVEEDQYMKLMSIVTRLEIVIAFLVGILLSTVAFCLARLCCRKKQKTYGNLSETLEMVTSREDPLSNAGQAVEVDQVQDQEIAGGAEAVAERKSNVDYSNIDFSLLRQKSPAEAEKTQRTSETEYAEVQKAGGGGEEEIICEDDETKYWVPEEKEGEDAAVYSTVEDVMGQI